MHWVRASLLLLTVLAPSTASASERLLDLWLKEVRKQGDLSMWGLGGNEVRLEDIRWHIKTDAPFNYLKPYQIANRFK